MEQQQAEADCQNRVAAGRGGLLPEQSSRTPPFRSRQTGRREEETGRSNRRRGAATGRSNRLQRGDERLQRAAGWTMGDGDGAATAADWRAATGGGRTKWTGGRRRPLQTRDGWGGRDRRRARRPERGART